MLCKQHRHSRQRVIAFIILDTLFIELADTLSIILANAWLGLPSSLREGTETQHSTISTVWGPLVCIKHQAVTMSIFSSGNSDKRKECTGRTFNLSDVHISTRLPRLYESSSFPVNLLHHLSCWERDFRRWWNLCACCSLMDHRKRALLSVLPLLSSISAPAPPVAQLQSLLDEQHNPSAGVVAAPKRVLVYGCRCVWSALIQLHQRQ
jgi:hypothetical protein